MDIKLKTPFTYVRENRPCSALQNSKSRASPLIKWLCFQSSWVNAVCIYIIRRTKTILDKSEKFFEYFIVLNTFPPCHILILTHNSSFPTSPVWSITQMRNSNRILIFSMKSHQLLWGKLILISP